MPLHGRMSGKENQHISGRTALFCCRLDRGKAVLSFMIHDQHGVQEPLVLSLSQSQIPINCIPPGAVGLPVVMNERNGAAGVERWRGNRLMRMGLIPVALMKTATTTGMVSGRVGQIKAISGWSAPLPGWGSRVSCPMRE